MKILMFGRGVIATVYGWALERAGHDVEFYVRPGRAAEYGDDDRPRPARHAAADPWEKRVVEKWPVRYRESLEPDHDFDLIVLSVSTTVSTEAAAFLAPRVGKATVLVFGNLWTEPADAIGAPPADQVAWGFPLAGGGFGEDGVLRGALLPSVIFGTLGRRRPTGNGPCARCSARPGSGSRRVPDFRGWLSVHFVSDAGLHSQGLRLGSLSDLAGHRRDLREAILAARELLPLLEARGVDLRRHRGSCCPSARRPG